MSQPSGPGPSNPPPPPGPGREGLLTVEQAAAWLGISPSKLAKQVAAREVPHVRLGRCVRFSLDDLAEIVAAGRQEPVKPPPLRVVGPGRRIA